MTGAPVYVAGPLGFTPAGAAWSHGVLLPALRGAGLEPLDPWATPEGAALGVALASDPSDLEALRAANDRVGAANVELIRRAAGVFAVLDGSDVDSGTAAEIGCASAWETPVVGLRTDSRRTGDNAGALVNLQVEYFITRTGGSVHTEVGPAVLALVALVAR